MQPRCVWSHCLGAPVCDCMWKPVRVCGVPCQVEHDVTPIGSGAHWHAAASIDRAMRGASITTCAQAGGKGALSRPPPPLRARAHSRGARTLRAPCAHKQAAALRARAGHPSSAREEACTAARALLYPLPFCTPRVAPTRAEGRAARHRRRALCRHASACVAQPLLLEAPHPPVRHMHGAPLPPPPRMGCTNLLFACQAMARPSNLSDPQTPLVPHLLESSPL